MILALITIGFGVFYVKKELDLSKQRLETINSLIKENQKISEERDNLKDRLNNYFEKNSKPLNSENEEKLEWMTISNLTDKVSSIKYTKEFACFDFSKDLFLLLQEHKIPSKIDIVKGKNKNELHAIVSIQIEPQSGEVVYYKTSDLVDQCFQSSENDNKFYCGSGEIETLPDKTEKYSYNDSD